MDARVLATFAGRMRPRPSLVRTAAQQGLTDPVLRRRQLTMIVQAERDRCRRRADAERRRSLDEHLAWLEQEVARLEQAIARAVAALPDGRDASGPPCRRAAVPGVGRITVATLLALLPEPGRLGGKAIASLTRGSGGCRRPRCPSGMAGGRRWFDLGNA